MSTWWFFLFSKPTDYRPYASCCFQNQQNIDLMLFFAFKTISHLSLELLYGPRFRIFAHFPFGAGKHKTSHFPFKFGGGLFLPSLRLFELFAFVFKIYLFVIKPEVVKVILLPIHCLFTKRPTFFENKTNKVLDTLET